MRFVRLQRFVSHPVTALLTGVLCLGIVAVVATANVSSGASSPVDVRRAECYRMVYGDPVGGAAAAYFPARIILLPGRDTGSVRLEGSSSRGTWWMFTKGSTWRAVGPDSI